MNFHLLGLLATLLPRAPIIRCRRNARDVCWSCYFQNFRDIAFACDLRQLGGVPPPVRTADGALASRPTYTDPRCLL